jgi:hypothetical protein
MRFVNINGLKIVGSGAFSTVYRLSSTRIIKVYDRGHLHDANIMSEEIELSMSSKYALPVLDVAIAKKKLKKSVNCYYAVIKRYLPNRPNWDEQTNVKRLLPRKLQVDCHSENFRKDEKGNIFLIDTQGSYALGCL